MHPVPVSLHDLPGLLASTIAAVSVGRLRVAVDGAAVADPGHLADALAAVLPVLGRPTARVSAGSFWRPASVRLEHGRHDAQSYRELWLDDGALRREVLDPFASTGRYLPELWDAERDRSARAPYVDTAEATVLLVDGTLLLDRGLPFDLTVHIRLSAGALRRRTPAEDAWTLPAYEDYPSADVADVVIRWDDPGHPAVVVRAG